MTNNPKWKWAIDKDSKTLVLFENGSAFEAEAWGNGEGDWSGLGRQSEAFSEEGREWRAYRSLPKAFRTSLVQQ